MFRRSLRRCVVFTQGYPALAEFAQRHFLPEHPLFTSALWLDENDFTACQQRAMQLGLPSLLKINPLSHHPELSPYAGKRRASQKGKANIKKVKKGSCGPADDVATGCGKAAGALNPTDPLKTSPGKPRGHEADVTLHAQRQRQDLTVPWNSPLRHAVSSQKEPQAQYRVPICTIEQHRHLYLYNLDQMKMEPGAGGGTGDFSASLFHPNSDGSGSDRLRHDGKGGDHEDPGADERRQIRELATNSGTGGAGKRHSLSIQERMAYAMRAAEQENIPPLYDPTSSLGAATSAGSNRGSEGGQAHKGEWSGYDRVDSKHGWSDNWSTTERDGDGAEMAALEQESIKLLRARFPNPSASFASNSGGYGGADLAFSVRTNKPYNHHLQGDLLRLAGLKGYRSQYWGTTKQWRSLGAVPQYRQREHLLYIPVKTKLVHISLIEDAAELLQRAFISSKSGVFSLLANANPDVLRRVREATMSFESQERTAQESHAVSTYFSEDHDGNPPNTPPPPLLHSNLPSVITNGCVVQPPPFSLNAMTAAAFRGNGNSLRKDLFDQSILIDMRVHKYEIPLYFSGLQLLSHGLSLKPQAQGIDLNALRNAQQQSLSFLAAIGGGDGIPPSVEQMQVGEANAQHHRGQWQHTPLALTAASMPGVLASPATQHYYHLSQVHFPAGFTIPLRVVTAELEANPGVALHGVTGQTLTFPELTTESVRNAFPEIAAVLLSATATKSSSAGSASASPMAEKSVNAELEEEPDILDALQSAIAGDAAAPLGSAYNRSKEADRNSNQGLLAGENRRKERLLAMSDDDFSALVRARTSPTNVDGRSLWFLAEDVLRLDGIVDVNASPVEVRSPSDNAGGAGNNGTGKGLDTAGSCAIVNNALYNVECLMNPEEGYRLVNQRAPGASMLQ